MQSESFLLLFIGTTRVALMYLVVCKKHDEARGHENFMRFVLQRSFVIKYRVVFGQASKQISVTSGEETL